MNPIYKFQLSDGITTRQAFPLFKDDLAVDYALEQNQEFYRGKLSGKLTFQRNDYAFISSKAFDTQFFVTISISYDGGETWAVYWSGQFWKTDCQFNEDEETVVVTPNVNDRYNAVLAGLEKEYNLIDLAPEIQPVKLDKRPMIQIYVPGQSVVGCVLSGMWWEQECDEVSDLNTLRTTYHFAPNKTFRVLEISQTGTPVLPDVVDGIVTQPDYGLFDILKGGYRFRTYIDDSDEENTWQVWQVIRVSDNVVMWETRETAMFPNIPYTRTLAPMENTGASGTVTISVSNYQVFCRLVTDVESPTSYNIQDDMVPDNRNYKYVREYYDPDAIWLSSVFSPEPTKWGIYQPGRYYDDGVPAVVGNGDVFPIARAAWGRVSLWYLYFEQPVSFEATWRKEYTLKDAFPIWSVISVLLGKIAPGITHEGTPDYSAFLYDENPITGIEQYLFITPKSNLIASGYDQPAQKAPITLKTVLDMLRDCFRCFWFIDEQDRFRIEHISYFMNGGAYPGTPNFPVVGINLTEQIVTRNGKPLSYARNQYQFEKPEMPARYQFGWMDDVTDIFDGSPIDVISKFVNPENIEKINVTQFTSDVDYILLNPGEISKDGFVLLSANLTGGEYKLQYVNFYFNDTSHWVQNAWVSFMYLQKYYMYDMPALDVEIDGVRQTVYGVKKLKTQTIKFPVLVEPNLFNLIKTELGNGTIQKMSVNLLSRNANATLKYDTE